VYLGILYETARQGLALEKARGERYGASAVVAGPPEMRVDPSDLALRQETRRWDEANLKTATMRTKEYAHDYRYFPEPDLVPMVFDDAWIERMRASLPELPEARLRRYTEQWGLSDYEAGVLADERPVADYLDAAVAAYGGDPKKISNWMQSDWMRLFNAAGRDLSAVKVPAGHLAEMVKLQDEGRITGKLAKSIFETMWETGKSPAAIVKEQGIEVVGSEDQLLPIIDQVLAENEKLVAAIKDGQLGKKNALVGQVMRATKGQARPDVVQKLIDQRLGLE
jgi:aspartyl-tRNA(Asn)/glutamyl-tRNA(Gln) amidotransferase subunit B